MSADAQNFPVASRAEIQRMPKGVTAMGVVALVLLTLQTVTPHMMGKIASGKPVPTAERDEEMFREIRGNQIKIIEGVGELTKAITIQTASQARIVDRLGDVIDQMRNHRASNSP